MDFLKFLIEWINNSSLELLGTFTGLLCIYYEVKEHHLTWPFGIISSAIYAVFLAKDNLYGQALFQLITIPVSVWGWQMWLRGDFFKQQHRVKIHNLSPTGWTWLFFVTAISALIAYLVDKYLKLSHFAFADVFSAILGVVALYMLGKKLIEQWFLWVIADGVPAVIMFIQGYYPSAILFTCYTVLVVVGYYNWRTLQHKQRYELS